MCSKVFYCTVKKKMSVRWSLVGEGLWNFWLVSRPASTMWLPWWRLGHCVQLKSSFLHHLEMAWKLPESVYPQLAECRLHWGQTSKWADCPKSSPVGRFPLKVSMQPRQQLKRECRSISVLKRKLQVRKQNPTQNWQLQKIFGPLISFTVDSVLDRVSKTSQKEQRIGLR